MIYQTLVIATGLAVAAWGHLVLNNVLGAASGWIRLDARFPPNTQTTPDFAGRALLIMGGLLVVVPILG